MTPMRIHSLEDVIHGVDRMVSVVCVCVYSHDNATANYVSK